MSTIVIGLLLLSSIVGFIIVRGVQSGAGFFGSAMYYLGQFCSNNNYRWLLCFFLTVAVTLNSFFIGFGEPVLYPALRNDLGRVVEKFGMTDDSDRDGDWRKTVGYVLHGEKKVPGWLKTEPQTEPKEIKGWTWIAISLWMWLFTLIYFPIALREEFAEACRKAWSSAKEWRKKQTEVAQTQVVSGGHAAPGNKFEFMKMLASDLFAEFIQLAWGRFGPGR